MVSYDTRVQKYLFCWTADVKGYSYDLQFLKRLNISLAPTPISAFPQFPHLTSPPLFSHLSLSLSPPILYSAYFPRKAEQVIVRINCFNGHSSECIPLHNPTTTIPPQEDPIYLPMQRILHLSLSLHFKIYTHTHTHTQNQLRYETDKEFHFGFLKISSSSRTYNIFIYTIFQWDIVYKKKKGKPENPYWENSLCQHYHSRVLGPSFIFFTDFSRFLWQNI